MHRKSSLYDHPLWCHDREVSLIQDWTSSLQIPHQSRWPLRLLQFSRGKYFHQLVFQILSCQRPSVEDGPGSTQSIVHLGESPGNCWMISFLLQDAHFGMKSTNEKTLHRKQSKNKNKLIIKLYNKCEKPG